jgi:hypothetical protein
MAERVPAACRGTCAGATPAPATPTSWPPSPANAPVSAVSASNAGAAPARKPPDGNTPAAEPAPGKVSCRRPFLTRAASDCAPPPISASVIARPDLPGAVPKKNVRPGY